MQKSCSTAELLNHKNVEFRQGFAEIQIRPPCDTFRGAAGEGKARKFEVYGYPFLARKPG